MPKATANVIGASGAWRCSASKRSHVVFKQSFTGCKCCCGFMGVRQLIHRLAKLPAVLAAPALESACGCQYTFIADRQAMQHGCQKLLALLPTGEEMAFGRCLA